MSNYGKSPRKKCSKCQKEKFLERDFYMSNSDKHADGRIGVCKTCINRDLKVSSTDEYMSDEFISKVKDILLDMNRPFIYSVWTSSVDEAIKRDRSIFGVVMKNINLNHRDKNWRDSEFSNGSTKYDEVKEVSKGEPKESKKIANKSKKRLDIELDTQNEKDVLRLLGYDPFEHEAGSDRANLFNKLIDYLDESTLEDGFKLTSVIEIVRTFNQLDKINVAISRTFERNNTDLKGVTSLVGAKDRMMKTALDIAKENGISVKHATNKSQGAGTLSGILKQLRDFDFHEADINLFDIETAEGIRQVADISNGNIMKQLTYDENDYTTMISEQRELIEHFERDAKKFEEDNRKLRVELDKRNKKERELENKIRELESLLGGDDTV